MGAIQTPTAQRNKPEKSNWNYSHCGIWPQSRSKT